MQDYSIESYYYLLVWCRTTPSSPTIIYCFDAGLLHRVLLLSIGLMQDYSIESYFPMRSGCEVSLYSCARNSLQPIQLRHQDTDTNLIMQKKYFFWRHFLFNTTQYIFKSSIVIDFQRWKLYFDSPTH